MRYRVCAEENAPWRIFLVDGSDTHTSMTLPLLQFLFDWHVEVLKLPPNMTHKLQPCDVEFFGELQKKLSVMRETWCMGVHTSISQYNISEIVIQSWDDVKSSHAAHSFQAAELWPRRVIPGFLEIRAERLGIKRGSSNNAVTQADISADSNNAPINLENASTDEDAVADEHMLCTASNVRLSNAVILGHSDNDPEVLLEGSTVPKARIEAERIEEERVTDFFQTLESNAALKELFFKCLQCATLPSFTEKLLAAGLARRGAALSPGNSPTKLKRTTMARIFKPSELLTGKVQSVSVKCCVTYIAVSD